MDGLPPPQYDHVPSIPVIERVLDTKDEANTICVGIVGKKSEPEGSLYWGCSIRKVKDGHLVCYIYRIDSELVLRHEYGHCNGWPANHPY